MSNPSTEKILIHKYLPHREPMLMVDYISEENLENVTTEFTIAESNLFVENGELVEAGLIENAAQSCSAIVAKEFFFDDNRNINEDVKVVGFISGIKSSTIYRLPHVGDTIQMKGVLGSRFDAEGYSICTLTCQTYLKEELLFEATINMFIQQINQ